MVCRIVQSAVLCSQLRLTLRLAPHQPEHPFPTCAPNLLAHVMQGAGMIAGGAAAGAGMGAASGQSMSPKAGDHGTTGFQVSKACTGHATSPVMAAP